MRGAESTAGSTPKRWATIGMSEPTVVDQTQIASMVSATVAARGRRGAPEARGPKATPPMSDPRSRPDRGLPRPPPARRGAEPDLAQGQAADDRHHRLRARVAAGADEQRDEEREGHHRRQLALVVAEHGAREGPGHEKQQQPADALAHDGRERVLEVGLVERSRVGFTAAIFRTSSVPSSIRTSMTSSTVTKPTTLPSFSTTGTASRLYLAIFWATTSWSSRASTVITGFVA